jgi:hypothetical protein
MPASILQQIHPYDRILRGAEALCEALNLVGEGGKPTAKDLRRFYHMAENKQIDVDQEGRIYVSTIRRLLKLPRQSA